MPMTLHNVARLKIQVDNASGTLSVAPRPSGRRVPFHEFQFTNLARPPVVRTEEVIQDVNSCLYTFPARPTFQVVSEWQLTGARIVRRFATPVRALAQRVECFDFHYRFETPNNLDFVPLLFPPPCTATQTPVAFAIQDEAFVITLNASAAPSGQIFIGPAESGGVEIRISSRGPFEGSLSFQIAPKKATQSDTALHILPPGMDASTFVVIALTPAVTPSSLLSARPKAKVQRSSPVLLVSGATGVRPRDIWASLFGRRIVRARVPEGYPSGDLARISDVVFYHDRLDSNDGLSPMIAYLKKLGPGKLPSTQLIIAISTDNDAYLRLQKTLAKVGDVKLANISAPTPVPVRIRQLELPDWSAIPAVLAEIGVEIDGLTWGGRTRASLRSLFASDPLRPVPVPRCADSVVQAPFLAAARLRGSAVFTDAADAWPERLKETNPSRVAAEIARYLLADLHSHEALLHAHGRASSHDEIWKECLSVIDKGDGRAERIVFALASGADARFDRLKLLPPLLYTGHVPSPLFAMRLVLSEQQKALNRFSEHMEDVARYWGSALKAADASPALETSSRLQACFQGEDWTALRDLVKLVKPKEFVNFSALPLEWWEIDGVPLGHLTKVATLHSQTLESDAGLCADLPTIYNTLVMDELGPPTPECRVLIVTPRYDGPSETNVNATIADLEQLAEDKLRAAQASGRDVVWRVVRPRTPSELEKSLLEPCSLLIYVGHAAEGMLSLPNGDLSPLDFPPEYLRGITSVLIGCDTKGASNLSQSVASRMVSVGARAVFSTSFTLPLTIARHLAHSLLTSLLSENLSAGDAIAAVRVWMLHNFMLQALARDRGLPVRDNVAFLPHRAFAQDSWLDTWTALKFELAETFLPPPSDAPTARTYAATILKRAATAGLCLTFAGDLRARLFAY
jgi:hypothetical protein